MKITKETHKLARTIESGDNLPLSYREKLAAAMIIMNQNATPKVKIKRVVAQYCDVVGGMSGAAGSLEHVNRKLLALYNAKVSKMVEPGTIPGENQLLKYEVLLTIYFEDGERHTTTLVQHKGECTDVCSWVIDEATYHAEQGHKKAKRFLDTYSLPVEPAKSELPPIEENLNQWYDNRQKPWTFAKTVYNEKSSYSQQYYNYVVKYYEKHDEHHKIMHLCEIAKRYLEGKPYKYSCYYGQVEWK